MWWSRSRTSMKNAEHKVNQAVAGNERCRLEFRYLYVKYTFSSCFAFNSSSASTSLKLMCACISNNLWEFVERVLKQLRSSAWCGSSTYTKRPSRRQVATNTIIINKLCMRNIYFLIDIARQRRRTHTHTHAHILMGTLWLDRGSRILKSPIHKSHTLSSH